MIDFPSSNAFVDTRNLYRIPMHGSIATHDNETRLKSVGG